MIATLQEPDRPRAHDDDGRGWQSELGELAFAGLMVLPGLITLGVTLWVIVAVVLR
jgi:hypothetical protein